MSDELGTGAVTRTTLPVQGSPLHGLSLTARPVTVFGGSGSALGHIAGLRDVGAVVTVVAARAAATVVDLADRGLVTWRPREFEPGDLDDPWLVVAATGDPLLDKQIAARCEPIRLWCLTDDRSRTPSAGGSGEGRVTLVGGGPGDPGLLTVAGLEALRSADVVVTDRLAPLSLLTEVPPGARVIDVGKVPRGPATSQQEINRLLVEHARTGCHVVRLKGGDSFLFGRGGEEIEACVAAGVPAAVVPGVTSALAVPAAAGIPVTHRGLSQGFTIVSGHVPPGDARSSVDYAALARSGTGLVLLMAVATLPAIVEALLDGGLPADTPAVTIADGTLPSQRVVRARVADLPARVVDAGIVPPAVTVIGAVAGFDPGAAP